MGLAGAVMGAGALGAVASGGSGLLQANAANTASQQQATQATNALNQQKQMFGVAQNALNPYINAGSTALPTLQALLTPGTSADELAQMPGFKFQSDYGTMAAENALSAQGLGGSTGPVAKAVSDYNNGLAGTYYNNTINNLMGFAGLGANAGSALAGNAINSGNAMATTYGNLGSAQAAGTLGSANALAGGINGIAGSGSNALLLNALLGKSGGAGGTGAATGLYSGLTYTPGMAAF